MLILASTQRMCHQSRPQRGPGGSFLPSDEHRLLPRNLLLRHSFTTGPYVEVDVLVVAIVSYPTQTLRG
jgi:hypothetical protein